MNTLGIDIETFSETNLITDGIYKYVADPSFEIVLFACSYNDGPIEVYDLMDGYDIPDEILEMLHDPTVKKTAWNAAFERACLSKKYGRIPPNQWECTMVKASMLSLPMSLDKAGEVLELAVQKDKVGGAYLKYFTVPCKPSKNNGMRSRNFPHHDPVKWAAFKGYVKTDVHVERTIGNKISWFEIPAQEQRLWEIDQEINDRGIFMDMPLVKSVIEIYNDSRAKAIKEAVAITRLPNPNSVTQLIKWLQEEMPLEDVEKLRKEDIPVLMEAAKNYTGEKDITRVLELRQELAKSSIKKYHSMIKIRGIDGRARGLFQFYGANRTGRWAGRLVQMHNLPKTTMKLLDLARQAAITGNAQLFNMIGFQDEDLLAMTTPGVLSQLIRTAFIPTQGRKFVVIDSSAIEARIIAWLSGEEWRMEVFKTHGKIYEASASKMFNVPFDDVSDDDRSRGKVAELALGYQGGPNAMIRMDLKKKIRKLAVKKYEAEGVKAAYRIQWDLKRNDEKKPLLTDDELLEEFVFSEYQAIVTAWRPENKAIGQMWRDLNDAAIEVVEGEGPRRVGFIKLYMRRGALFVELPSGRCLVYLRPAIRTKIIHPKKGDPFEVTGVAYMGVDQETKTWRYEHTYGGKLTENICQAIARDCLGYWIEKIHAAGYIICGHVHDEAIIECETPLAEPILKHVTEIMSKEIPWAPGLPLAAKGFITDYYKKD